MGEIKTMRKDRTWALLSDQIIYLRERLNSLITETKTVEDIAILQPLLEEVEAILDKYKSRSAPKED